MDAGKARPMTVIALIVAAGSGSRMGGEVPKQFRPLAGKAVLAHAVDALAPHPAIDAVRVVIGEGQDDIARRALGGRDVGQLIVGGAERADSVQAGLRAVEADIILIHDAARPFCPPVVIDRLLALGGFVATYANSVPEFLSEWRSNRAAPHGNTITGYGYGTDVNGLGDQANARPDAATNPLVYPFTAPNGVTVHRQTFGTRTFDLNTDGAAQYGLFGTRSPMPIVKMMACCPMPTKSAMSRAKSSAS